VRQIDGSFLSVQRGAIERSLSMLVLSRKQGQSIVIANDIVVQIMDIGHGRVQVGISAPQHMPIHREEVYRRIQAENQARKSLPYAGAELPVASGEYVGTA
jgi:carbon storage regulator